MLGAALPKSCHRTDPNSSDRLRESYAVVARRAGPRDAGLVGAAEWAHRAPHSWVDQRVDKVVSGPNTHHHLVDPVAGPTWGPTSESSGGIVGWWKGCP